MCGVIGGWGFGWTDVPADAAYVNPNAVFELGGLTFSVPAASMYRVNVDPLTGYKRAFKLISAEQLHIRPTMRDRGVPQGYTVKLIDGEHAASEFSAYDADYTFSDDEIGRLPEMDLHLRTLLQSFVVSSH
jgi:hypothetical protein